MAVFTPLSPDDITRFLAHYSLGELQGFEPISAGIENTNYFVTTPHGRWVLTVFERLNFAQLPFYLELMRHLARRDLPVPMPQENNAGSLLSEVRGKPAAIATRMPGRWIAAPSTAHCACIGTLLARMHLAAQDYPKFQPNLRGIGWWKSTLPRLDRHIPDHLFTLLAEEVIHQDSFFRSPGFEALPSGPVHADLFRDNVLWDGAGDGAPDQLRVGGVIDFYFAGCTLWLYDLAVTVNDWCVDVDSGAFDLPRAKALLNAYHAMRPLLAAEHDAWQTVLRAAALRFWISRLYDFYLPRPATMLTPHDPSRFERMLALRIADSSPPWVD
jgi:homoserine kinase type II